jgi:ribose-phosphate pyrophosphokinase
MNLPASNAMMIAALPGNEPLTRALTELLAAEPVSLEHRRFPDGESYLRWHADLSGASVILVASLDRPDDKFLPLLFAADAARDLGAARVGLVAPYLAYMRQDCRFNSGEALTSKNLRTLAVRSIRLAGHGRSASSSLCNSLDEIYTLKSEVVQAAPALADWIAEHVERPVLIGPDAESEQWVKRGGRIAKSALAGVDQDSSR